MDAKHFAALFCFALLVSGCGKNGLNKIFPSYQNNNSTGNQQQSSQAADCSSSAMSVSALPNQFVVKWKDGHVSLHKEETDTVFVNKFVVPHMQDIELVEYDQLAHTMGTLSQNSPTQATANWGQQIINLGGAQTAGFYGQGVLVAVVDTAIDYTHPDLQGRLVPGWDFVSNTAQAAAPQEHATHVAGVIAANLGGDVQGVAPKSQVMGVSFMDSTGSGTLGNAILALKYAAQHGAKIINNSWGGSGCMASFQTTMQDLSNQGVLLMVAAGNDGLDLGQSPTYPAVFNLPNQLTIAASQENDFMSTFSNSSWTLVHLAAPGQDIYSTVPGGYAYMSGTSMATPFMTGAAAVLMSAVPKATATQVKQALLAGVDAGPFRVVSQGRLNLQKAIQQLQSMVH